MPVLAEVLGRLAGRFAKTRRLINFDAAIGTAEYEAAYTWLMVGHYFFGALVALTVLPLMSLGPRHGQSPAWLNGYAAGAMGYLVGSAMWLTARRRDPGERATTLRQSLEGWRGRVAGLASVVLGVAVGLVISGGR